MKEEQNNIHPQSIVTQPIKIDSDSKIFAALSYLSILFIIPWIIKRNDGFVKFHIRQGVTLFLIEVVAWFILYLIESLLVTLFSFGSISLVSFLYQLAWLFFAAISIVGVYYAARGIKKKIPILWDLSQNIKI